tara:strand:- start:2453 stop:2947 length:495 start_codon:yes stop_codon:yes gene_type:complete
MTEHNTLTGSQLHEPKGIDSASTSDAGKVLTPSSSTAGEGELRKLLESEINSKVCYITLDIDDVSTAGSVYLPLNFSGTITSISSVLHGTIATADTTLTPKISGTNITDGALTLEYSGSAEGDLDSSTPTANNTFTSANYLEVETDGASTNTVKATLMFTITRA